MNLEQFTEHQNEELPITLKRREIKALLLLVTEQMMKFGASIPDPSSSDAAQAVQGTIKNQMVEGLESMRKKLREILNQHP